MKKVLFFLLPALLLISCDSSKVYQKFEDMPNNTWSRDNVVTFTVDIQDIASNYDVDLAVRHTSYYPWANLKVNLTSVYPSGEERTRDYEFFVRNTDSSFKGEGAGDIWDINFEWLSDISFPEKGTYTFKVQNIMPLVETADIMQIGLIVRKSE